MKKKLLIKVGAVVIGAVVIVATVLWIRKHEAAATASCVMMLRQIDGAKQQWAIENHKGNGAQMTWDDIRSFFKGLWNGEPPWDECPGGGHYTIGPIGRLPSCSIKKHQAAFEAEIGRPPNPQHAADGSQPFGSVTVPTTLAAGSHR